MYLRFSDPIDTSRPARVPAETWVSTVRDNTQRELEAILRDLLALRADDPFRELNPLAWSRAVA